MKIIIALTLILTACAKDPSAPLDPNTPLEAAALVCNLNLQRQVGGVYNLKTKQFLADGRYGHPTVYFWSTPVQAACYIDVVGNDYCVEGYSCAATPTPTPSPTP